MIYTVKKGDTLTKLAIRFYGNIARYTDIYEANPILSGRSNGRISDEDLIIVGEKIIIPDDFSESIPSDDLQKISIIVNGREFFLFDGITITLALDAVAHAFAFTCPNTQDIDVFFYDAFRPLSYARCEIWYAGEKKVDGSIIKVKYDDNTMTIEGYSKAGVLQSCTMSPASYPRQFNGATLTEIATKLCKPFGIDVIISDTAKQSASIRYPEAEIGEADTIAGYLISLAQERGLVIRPATDGGILIDKVIPSEKEVLFLDADSDPTLPMSIDFDGDKLFSDYTGLSSDGEGDSAVSMKSSAKLDFIPVFRPHTITQSDGKTSAELNDFTKSEIGRTIRSAINFSVGHYSWDTDNGKMFDAGQIISVRNIRLRIRKSTKFLINSVTLSSSSSEGRKATFELVIASSYNNELEQFWQI